MPTNFGKNTEHHDEHGIEKPVPHPAPKFDAEHPGYETTDVNTRGVVVFMGGMLAFLVIFFVLCFAMGKAINFSLLKQDFDESRLNPQPVSASGQPLPEHKGRNLADNPYLEQQESARIAKSFPSPRLDADDSDQSTSDLHAREDLLLLHTTQNSDGSIRIPIDQAMALIVQRGLPAPAAQSDLKPTMAGEQEHVVTAPLTNGFARTSYEIDQIESREQKMRLAHETSGETAPANRK